MAKEQWKTLFQRARKRKDIEEAISVQAEEMRSHYAKYANLATSDSWQLFENYFDKKIFLLRDLLEIAKQKDVVDIQKEIKAIKDLKSFLRNAILQSRN